MFTVRHHQFSAVSSKEIKHWNVQYNNMKNRFQTPGHTLLFIALILTGWSFQNASLCSLAPQIHSTVWGTIIFTVEINSKGYILG